MSVEGVRVLVTGGTSGLGRARAEAQAEAGPWVALTSGDPDRAADVVASAAGKISDGLPEQARAGPLAP